MNILFSITYYAPYVSGLTIYAKRVAEALTEQHHYVRVLCMRHNPKLPSNENVHGVSVIRAKPIGAISKGFLSIEWIFLCIKHAFTSDVIVVHLPQAEGCVLAFFGRIFGKKVISIYHCEVALPQGLFNKCVQTLLEVSHALSLLFSHKIITYTKEYADASRLLLPYRNKVTSFYPPVPKPVQDREAKQKIQKKIGPSDIIIGISARVAKEKGIEYAFGALPLLIQTFPAKKIKIVIAGPLAPVGEESYRKEIVRLSNKFEKYIVFLDSLSQSDIGAYYSLLDVLVLPSVNSTEAFGMVQVEAMLTGIPVVASNLPGVRVPIERTGMGIIIPIRNSRAIADAITEIVNHKSRYVKHVSVIEKEFCFNDSVRSFLLAVSA